MSIEVREYPANPPAKRRMQQDNAVTIELQAMAVEHIDLRGWNVENRVATSIDRIATGKLRNSGGIMRIRGEAALTWGAALPWNRHRFPPRIGGLPRRSPARLVAVHWIMGSWSAMASTSRSGAAPLLIAAISSPSWASLAHVKFRPGCAGVLRALYLVPLHGNSSHC
jgi:hypothetical protein